MTKRDGIKATSPD